MSIKRIFIFSIIFLFCNTANAQVYLWRYQTHATDCSSLSSPKERDLCYEQDDKVLYKYHSGAWHLIGENEYLKLDGSNAMTGILSGTDAVFSSDITLASASASIFTDNIDSYSGNGIEFKEHITFNTPYDSDYGGNFTQNYNFQDAYVRFVQGTATNHIWTTAYSNQDIEFAFYADGYGLTDSFSPYISIGTYTAGDSAYWQSDKKISVYTNADTDDFLSFQTISDVPEIITQGDCDLKLSASSGNIAMGDASTETTTFASRMIVRAVTYITNMNTDVAGSTAEIVFCSTDSIFYGCTSGGVAGSATWTGL